MNKLLQTRTACVSNSKQDNPCLECLRDIEQHNIHLYNKVSDSYKISKNFKPNALKKCTGFIQK